MLTERISIGRLFQAWFAQPDLTRIPPSAPTPRSTEATPRSTEATPPRPNANPRLTLIDSHTADRHAHRLLKWLHGDVSGAGGEWGRIEPTLGDLLSKDLEAIYLEMCCELFWAPKAWSTLARAFSELIWVNGRPRKTYARVYDKQGRLHRLRVYPIPTPPRSAPTPRSTEATPPPRSPTPRVPDLPMAEARRAA